MSPVDDPPGAAGRRPSRRLLEGLCDLVRGVADPADAAVLEARLAADPEARRLRQRLAMVAEVGRADAASEVPAAARRLAHALGSLRRPADPSAAAPRWWRRAVELAFDSFHAPAAVGVRDLHPSPRRLVYAAGDLLVDVRRDPPAPEGAAVVGQVLRGRAEPEPVPDVPVLFAAGERVVGWAVSERFGEFVGEGLPAGPLRLCLLVGDDEIVELPLPAADEDGPEDDAEGRS